MVFYRSACAATSYRQPGPYSIPANDVGTMTLNQFFEQPCLVPGDEPCVLGGRNCNVWWDTHGNISHPVLITDLSTARRWQYTVTPGDFHSGRPCNYGMMCMIFVNLMFDTACLLSHLDCHWASWYTRPPVGGWTHRSCPTTDAPFLLAAYYRLQWVWLSHCFYCLGSIWWEGFAVITCDYLTTALSAGETEWYGFHTLLLCMVHYQRLLSSG